MNDVEITATTPRTGPFAAQGFGCPKCGSILNAKAASCDGDWHSDNRREGPAVPPSAGPTLALRITDVLYEACAEGPLTLDEAYGIADRVARFVGAQVSALQAERERLRAVADDAVGLLLCLGFWGLDRKKEAEVHAQALGLRARLATVDQAGPETGLSATLGSQNGEVG